MRHEPAHERILRELFEHLALVEQVPHPLVRSGVVDVVGAVGDLGLGLLDHTLLDRRESLRVERALEEAVPVLRQVGLSPLDVGGEGGRHRAESGVCAACRVFITDAAMPGPSSPSSAWIWAGLACGM